MRGIKRRQIISEVTGHKAGMRPLLIPAMAAVTGEELLYRISGEDLLIKGFCLTAVVSGITVLAILFMRHDRAGAASALAAVLLVSFCAYTTFDAYDHQTADEGDILHLTGTVSRCVSRLDGINELYLKTDDYGMVICYWDEALCPGCRFTVEGTLRTPDKAYNPGQFDQREYLRRKGIEYILYPAEGKDFVCQDAQVTGKIIHALSQKALNARRYVLDLITDGYGEGYGAVAAALFTGDKSLTDDSVKSDFRRAGCSHILAVSGTHFTGFLMWLPSVFDALRAERKKRLAGYITACMLIGCFTGWSESVTRAAVMSICYYASGDRLSGMCLATVIMTIADPFSLLGNAFRMSFASGLAIMILSGPISSFLTRIIVSEKFSGIIAVYLSARIGILPFSEGSGLILTPVAVAVQILSGTAAQAACAFFVPCCIITVLIRGVSVITAAPCMIPVEAIVRMVSCSADRVTVHDGTIRLTSSFYPVITAGLIAAVMPRSLIRKGLAVTVAFALALNTGNLIFDHAYSAEATVVFIDVGQGDACLIMCDGTSILIDTGTPEAYQYSLIPVLDYYGIGIPDMVIISHWDRDHAGGALELIKDGRCGMIYAPYDGVDEQTCGILAECLGLDIEGTAGFMAEKVTVLSAGDRISTGSDMSIDVLHPSDPIAGDNENSLVLTVDLFGTKILFTGDIGEETESYMVGSGVISDIDILKAPHHGSRYSSSKVFLDACLPELTVISAGRGNMYGHPAEETLERLQEAGSDIRVTRYEGAVIIDIYQGHIVVR